MEGSTLLAKALNLTAHPFASSITDSGTLSGFSYGLWNEPGSGNSRILTADILSRNNEVNPNYSLRDFSLPTGITATYRNDNGFKGIYNYEGRTGHLTSDVVIRAEFTSDPNLVTPYVVGHIGQDRDLVIEGDNFGYIRFTGDINGNGKFDADYVNLSNNFGETGTVIGAFSDVKYNRNPSLVAGEVKIKGRSRENAIVGVFVAEIDE